MIAYAVNRETKEHRRADSIWQQMKYGTDWKIVQADIDGWIPWGGGECPLPNGARYAARLKNGAVYDDLCGPELCNVEWAHSAGYLDIIAYRPTLDERSEREAENRTPEGAAVATLERLGYRYCGGTEWKPPLGPSRSFEADGDYFVFGDSESAEWDGHLAPPIGVECDAQWLEPPDGGSRDFEPVLVKGRFGSYVWFTTQAGEEVVRILDSVRFRPILSEEDRAIEAMLALDDYNTESYNSGMMSRDDFCRALYRAGYRKS